MGDDKSPIVMASRERERDRDRDRELLIPVADSGDESSKPSSSSSSSHHAGREVGFFVFPFFLNSFLLVICFDCDSLCALCY